MNVLDTYEIDINWNIIELIEKANMNNFIDTCKALKVKYGISYKVLAKASKINASTLRTMIQLGYYSEDTALEGVENLKNYFLA